MKVKTGIEAGARFVNLANVLRACFSRAKSRLSSESATPSPHHQRSGNDRPTFVHFNAKFRR